MSTRFFLLAVLLWWFGDAARPFIERRLTLVTSIFAVLLVGGFVVLRWMPVWRSHADSVEYTR